MILLDNQAPSTTNPQWTGPRARTPAPRAARVATQCPQARTVFIILVGDVVEPSSRVALHVKRAWPRLLKQGTRVSTSPKN